MSYLLIRVIDQKIKRIACKFRHWGKKRVMLHTESHKNRGLNTKLSKRRRNLSRSIYNSRSIIRRLMISVRKDLQK